MVFFLQLSVGSFSEVGNCDVGLFLQVRNTGESVRRDLALLERLLCCTFHHLYQHLRVSLTLATSSVLQYVQDYEQFWFSGSRNLLKPLSGWGKTDLQAIAGDAIGRGELGVQVRRVLGIARSALT